MALLFRRPLPINKITITPKALKRQMSVAMSGKPLVFVDFDQTVTTEETTPLLGQWALDTNKIPLSWSFFVDSYMQDYREIKERLPEGLSEEETFDALRPAEEKSLARIRDHGVFKDLSRDMVFKQASQVRAKYIQADALDALGRVPLETLSILSVNWSKDWILGFLEPAGVSRDNIKCNDLVLDDRGKTTGEITTDILTASDKWRKVQQLLPQDKFPFIYIGDSFGDLLPLGEENRTASFVM